MSEITVCALVRGGSAEVVAAAEGQTRPPDELFVDASPPGATWLWLLDDGVVPEPDALAQLLDFLERWEGPAPDLLASKVVTRDGTPRPGSLPVPRMVDDQDLVVTAFERHAFPVRIARAGSLLVRAGALDGLGLPRPRREIAWTARLLRDRLGLLVPASVAVAPNGDDGLELVAWLELLVSGALRASEKPLFAFRLAEAVVARLRGAR